ncbi:MAG: toprim domain-containing protein, partial [Candidatus Babeliales bacterium]
NRETCYFCESENRDARIICVVSSWHDLLAIEKTGGYKGMYHMLGGVISPLDGIGPEKLTISQLLQRVDKGVEELIITFNQTPEGEATAAFIAKKLEGVDINITCLARGMPIGSSLVYMDRLTIYKALSDRRPF